MPFGLQRDRRSGKKEFGVLTYALRIFLASKKLSYLGTVSGILAFVILFVETIGLIANREILLMSSLFVYMIGSEFTVRAKLSSARYLLLYDLVPVENRNEIAPCQYRKNNGRTT